MGEAETVVYRGLESLQDGKVVPVVPQGISMLPFIKGGLDQVFLLKKDSVEVGDIVLAVYHGQHILHRVYAIEGEQLTLMGDGNLEGVEKVTKAQVLGTAVEIADAKGRRRKPTKAWLWRKLLPMRRMLLKVHRKWKKLWNK